MLVAFVIVFNKVTGMAASDRLRKDSTGVVVIENEDVTHVAVGGDRKATWEVRANETLKVLPSKGGSVYFVVAFAMLLWWGECSVYDRERSVMLRGVDVTLREEDSLTSAFHFPHNGLDGFG